ncbi:MAG: SurA N-terminal domain-containing protein [Spirochaetes bacterium]|nr:SurA N-terminal domain-containing protein [Spirochaetota bacterium]
MRKKFIFTALFLLMVSAAGFNASSEIVNGIACKVGNEIITIHEFERAYDQMKVESVLYGKPQPTRREVMNDLVEKILLTIEAERKGIVVTEEELEGIVDNIKKQNNLTDEALLRELEKEKLTITDLKNQYRQEILTSRLVNQLISERGDRIADEEIRSFYNDPENKRLITLPGIVKLSVILVRASGELSYQESIELKKRALEAYERAMKGESFTALVAEYSGAEAASAAGGYIGSFTKEQLLSMMTADNVETIFSLDEKEIAPPIRFKDGYRIFRLDGKTEQKLLTFEESYENIKSYLLKIKGDELLDRFLAEMKEAVVIQYLIDMG